MTNTDKFYYKDALKSLKQQLGGAKPELLDRNKKMTKLVKDVKKAVVDGATTVPEIAELIKIPTDQVFYAINALRRYDDVVLVSKRGEYPTYGLKEVN